MSWKISDLRDFYGFIWWHSKKAANYNLIGKIVARCSEHLDEFLRRNIPIRLLLPSFGIQNLPPMPVQYCKSNFNSNIHIFGINCPHSNGKHKLMTIICPWNLLLERVITIAGNSEAKGKTVACLLERSDETLKEFADDLVSYFIKLTSTDKNKEFRGGLYPYNCFLEWLRSEQVQWWARLWWIQSIWSNERSSTTKRS